MPRPAHIAARSCGHCAGLGLSAQAAALARCGLPFLAEVYASRSCAHGPCRVGSLSNLSRWRATAVVRLSRSTSPPAAARPADSAGNTAAGGRPRSLPGHDQALYQQAVQNRKSRDHPARTGSVNARPRRLHRRRAEGLAVPLIKSAQDKALEAVIEAQRMSSGRRRWSPSCAAASPSTNGTPRGASGPVWPSRSKIGYRDR